MTVNFRYRVEIEGEEPFWMWHRDAAVAKVDVASRRYLDGTREMFSPRVRTAKVIDEETGIVIVDVGPDA